MERTATTIKRLLVEQEVAEDIGSEENPLSVPFTKVYKKGNDWYARSAAREDDDYKKVDDPEYADYLDQKAKGE